MKILLLNTFDIQGGAAIATFRLFNALSKQGIDVKMLVKKKESGKNDIIGPESFKEKLRSSITGTLDLLPAKIMYKKNFSTSWVPDKLISKIYKYKPDVVHLNWINGGFLSIRTIGKLNLPIVWTLHDMWPFTGGCHYNYGCENFKTNCGYCKQLDSNKKFDLSYLIFKRKIKYWRDKNITIVTPSKWLADEARASLLFNSYDINIIPNGLNTNIYQPYDKTLARKLYGLPQNKKLILFGAINPLKDKRKGFELLYKSLNILETLHDSNTIELVVFGSASKMDLDNFNFKVHYIEHLYDQYSLALLYSAADIMVVPSYQEAFGQTASESLACATPVVAFKATGLIDIVDHKINGYLAEPFDCDELAIGIKWVLEDEKRYNQLCVKAREKAIKEYNELLLAKRYIKLYEKILNR